MKNQINATAVAQAFPANHTTWKPMAPGPNGTLIAVVLDESGSMASVWDSTINGFNEFLQGQAASEEAGRAYLTLVKFEGGNIRTLCENANVRGVTPLDRHSYRPAGGTNLKDAIGETMNRVNGVLESVPEAERPGVLIVIITDGEENASHRFSGEQIKTMVKLAEAQDWSYLFLGANVDAFSMGQTFGMNAANTASYSTAAMGETFSTLSKTVSSVRMMKSRGISTEEMYASASLYSAEDRSRMKGGK